MSNNPYLKWFSGRLDQWADEEEVILWFIQFTERFEAEEALLCFEDLTKSQIPTKPHYHFMLLINGEKYKHDYVRRWMSKHPELSGPRSSLKIVAPNTLDKAFKYTLKQVKHQQYIPYYDMDEGTLIRLIEDSVSYQETVTVNKWKDHLTIISDELKIKYTKHFPSRREILEHMGKYIYTWNQDKAKPKLSYPVNLKSSIHFIESDILDKDTYLERFLLDNEALIYEHDIKRYCNKTKVTKIYPLRGPEYYEAESEPDEDMKIQTLDSETDY